MRAILGVFLLVFRSCFRFGSSWGLLWDWELWLCFLVLLLLPAFVHVSLPLRLRTIHCAYTYPSLLSPFSSCTSTKQRS
ncbi:hypothetical protein EDB19DRAFT_1673940 [Suillus lakei]|nr:hypothetical protein EDB19DRAFT_1673940 [Suillus lakei]